MTLILSSIAAGCASAGQSGPLIAKWNIADHFAPEAIIVQSHRGAGALAEENTVAAFELGWQMGTIPECDLRTTSDGVIVTFHDANFARVVKDVSPTMRQQGVKDVTFTELLKLDVGAWRGDQFVSRKISKLTDAFAAMKGRPERRLYLDIKQVSLPQLADEVKAYGVERQILFTTPDPALIAEFQKLVPDADSLLWMRGNEEDLRARIAALSADGFKGITHLQIHIFPTQTIEEALALATITADRIKTTVAAAQASPNQFTVSDAFIRDLGEELRSRGVLFQALPYTTDISVCDRLFDLGVMSIATDYPDKVRDEIRAYCAKRKARAGG